MAKKRTEKRAFKLQALALIKTSQQRSTEIERDLGSPPGRRHTWKARLKVEGQQAFPGTGRLKRAIEVLRQERGVLRKALAIFCAGEEKSTSL